MLDLTGLQVDAFVVALQDGYRRTWGRQNEEYADILRWVGTPNNPFNGAGTLSDYCGFQVVGVMPGFPGQLASYDGKRLVASTWNMNRNPPDASVAATLAPNAAALIAAQAVLGVGAALVLPTSLSLLSQVFEDPEGDHDWGIEAEVDLAASDEAGAAAIRITAVGPH